MTRYVLAYFACKLVFVIVLGFASLWIEGQPPNLSTPANIVCTALSISWFIKRENQPLAVVEIFNFSIGTVLADFILSFTWVAAMMWLSSVPISWEGLDAAVFGGGGNIETTKEAVYIGGAIGSLQVFLISASFAWLLTRKLPKRQSSTDNHV